MKRYKQSETDALASILKQDGVISVPTDTVYGICARIGSEKAYNNLEEIKERPSNKSFPIMCANLEQIKEIAIVDEQAEKLIKAFMPGPITLVLNKKHNACIYINNRGTTETSELAVRMATSKPLEELLSKVESPIFLTSANKNGQASCSSLAEIEETFPNIDGIMEGEVSFGKASTIVDCTKDEIKVQRDGPITLEQIQKILNQ